MKKSERNKRVIENFILFITHQNREEAKNEAKVMYNALDDYIVNDYVDGVDGDEDDDTYVLVQWPESQEYMEEEWFENEAILHLNEPSAYFIPINRIK